MAPATNARLWKSRQKDLKSQASLGSRAGPHLTNRVKKDRTETSASHL